MPNKTFYEIVNQQLRLNGELPYDSTSEFDNGPHDKTKLQCKEWHSLLHQWLMQTPRSRFLLRDFTFNTADGDNDYDLDATTNYERILEDSFFITTSGQEYGPLDYVDIQQYRREFPANDEAEGRPTRWFFRYRAANVGPDHIGFSPPPDTTYAIRYSAFIKPFPLTSNSTEIAFSQEWEHLILLWGATFLEIAKAQGKGADYGQFINQLRAEFEQHTVPVSGGEHLRLDPLISIYGRRGAADICQTDYWTF